MAINTALKLAILTSGKTQTVIAKRAGMGDYRLSRIVRGHDEPYPGEKRRLAKVLRVPIRQLFPVPSDMSAPVAR